MVSPVAQALDLVSAIDAARSAEEVGRRLLDALRPFGARSLYAASFPIPVGVTTEAFIAGRHLFAQLSPKGWTDNYAPRGLHRSNPVLFGPPRRATAFRWSEPGFPDLKNWPGLALARDLGVADGFAVPCHGPGNRVGVVSFGFERLDLGRQELLAISLAAHVAHERMAALSPPEAGPAPKAVLTAREVDCLSFVAEGLSDGEIGARLGISTTTAHAHVENAKRKLHARTRAQAVARACTLGLI
ncbi:helix-turn-helix transcriptional regulator [Phreatobacter sp.]|uniref:helix-turn-helix transcriptional regulator n=1 Tax=Phreatobacter sp. TaxID=1966341 RepID=UPI003F716E90